MVAVRGLHKFWALEGVTPTDPASDVHPPMPGKRLPKAISVDEVTRILEAVGTDTATGLRDRALLEFLYSTGARISEAVGLDVDDISLHSGEAGDAGPAIVRLFGKGSKERLVPLGSFGARALDAYLVRGRPLLAAKGKGSLIKVNVENSASWGDDIKDLATFVANFDAAYANAIDAATTTATAPSTAYCIWPAIKPLLMMLVPCRIHNRPRRVNTTPTKPAL